MIDTCHDPSQTLRTGQLAEVYSPAPAGREDCEEAAMALEARSIVGVLSQDSDRATCAERTD